MGWDITLRYAGAMRRRYCAAWRSTWILWYCFVLMLLCCWGKGVWVFLYVLLLPCGQRGGVLAPHGGLLGFSGTVLYRCCFAVGARDERVTLHSFVDLRVSQRVLAPHLAAAAALWQPPAAKEG